jgi:transcription initiation factor TFIIH subunit 4
MRTRVGEIHCARRRGLISLPGNPLQIAVLNLFVSFKSRFSNLIVGVLTRESVKRALINGITAEQVIPILCNEQRIF